MTVGALLVTLIASSTLTSAGLHAGAAAVDERRIPHVVDAPIIDGFRPPQCRWCPGNRGVKYGSAPGQTVTAVRSGYVSFAGRVAGVGYVVVALSDGRRVTYGGVDPTRWQIGDPVHRGVVIGVAEGQVHLGLREGDRYLDPALLTERASVRARLVAELPGGG